MRANRGSTGGGGGESSEKGGASGLGSRTDRGNQNDQDIGSSASRGGGGGESNAPRSANPPDLDAMPDAGSHFAEGGSRSSGNPDVTGTTDAVEE